MSIKKDKLLISSSFFSVQGEGISTGIPSYFVRLGLCNLSCGMSKKYLNQTVKEKLLEDGEITIGDLELEGIATWTCDSISQWAWRGEDKDFQFLLDEWHREGIYDDILKGNIHVIWTGGEPTIKQHQDAIINFTIAWREAERANASFSPYYEVETNGTIPVCETLFNWFNQINCSPKLSNSGMLEKDRIKPDAINKILQHKNYQFKFVISNENDIQEMFDTYIIPFKIPLKNVVCMPGMDKQEQFNERTQWCLEMAKKYRFRGMCRLHVAAWGEILNV